MTNGLELQQKEVFKHKGLPDHSFVRKPLALQYHLRLLFSHQSGKISRTKFFDMSLLILKVV